MTDYPSLVKKAIVWLEPPMVREIIPSLQVNTGLSLRAHSSRFPADVFSYALSYFDSKTLQCTWTARIFDYFLNVPHLLRKLVTAL